MGALLFIELSRPLMLSTALLWLLVASNPWYMTNALLVVIAAIAVSLVTLLHTSTSVSLLYNGYVAYDGLTASIVLVSALVAVWLIATYSDRLATSPRSKGSVMVPINNELIALVVILLIGVAALASSNSYLALFVAIELQSLVLYILLALSVVPSVLSNTSYVSLSYLINAAIATALLLFGMASSSTVLVLVALVWKLGVIPVHVWSLPVLDNVSSIVASIYLTLAKYGLLVVIALVASSSALSATLLGVIGLVNLTLGNVLGLLQVRYQRIIVYSSMIQIGYMLLVISQSTSLALSYFEMYSLYTVMLLVLWTLPTYSQYYGNLGLPAVQLWTMVLVLYTVSGLPYMPLFWTKLDILLAVDAQLVAIALVSTLLSSLIYVRLLKYIAFYR